MAVANELQRTVEIYSSNGDGTFARTPLFPLQGKDPSFVALEDLDDDADLDLVVISTSSPRRVWILLNDGFGQFGSGAYYSVGRESESLAAADFDGDGDVDLAVPDSSSGTMFVLLNDGDATFVESGSFDIGGGPPLGVTAADLDADGDVDLVMTRGAMDTVRIFLNAGNASFVETVSIGVGSQPESVAAGDLDLDGDIDLTVANADSGNVSVLLNRGDGSFAPAVNYAAGSDPSFVIMAGLDNDGELDIAVANFSSGNVSVLLNTTTRTHTVTLDPGDDVSGIRFGNRTAPLTIGDASLVEGDSGTADMEFAVELSESFAHTLTVDYATADGTATVANNDYVPVSGTLTFPPGEVSRTIAVSINGDTMFEPDKNFFVHLSDPNAVIIADDQASDTILNDDWTIDVALVPVLTPSPNSLPGSPLPTPADTVAAGGTYYLEVWARDTGKGTPAVGITGGAVDLHYTTVLADALTVRNLDFNILPTGTIDDPNGLVDNLGGGSFSPALGTSPNWARLAYVELLAVGHGDVTFELSPGAFQFSRWGLSNVDWEQVGLRDVATVRQLGGTRIDMTLVRQPTEFDEQDTGEVDALPASEQWIHGWKPFYVELWASTPDSTSAGISGGTIDLHYDTSLTTAAEIEYGPAFTLNQTGTLDDLGGTVHDVGGTTARTDVGDDRFALLARVRFVPAPDDHAAVDETGHFVGPYDLELRLADPQMEVDSAAVGCELGPGAPSDLYGVFYDIDENDLIDFGDFSFFAAAFFRPAGGAEPPYTWWADFDKSNLVDFGDLSVLAPNFGRGKPDANVSFPPGFPGDWVADGLEVIGAARQLAATSSESPDTAVRVELVAVTSPTGSDQLPTLPDSLTQVSIGSTYFIELWVQEVAAPAVGISEGQVDISYTTTATDASAVNHGGVFTMFTDGKIEGTAGLVDDFGGGTLSPDIGVAPNWARLGYVQYTTTSASQVDFTLSPGRLSFSRFGAGNVGWAEVEFGSLVLNPTVTLYWDEQGDGNWSDIVDGNSRWVDSIGSPLADYPDDESTDVVVKTDTLTVTENRLARSLTIQSGTLAVNDDVAVSLGGNLHVSANGTLAAGLVGDTNVTVDAEGIANLGGTLALEAVDSLGDLGAGEWGYQTRTIIEADQGVNGTFAVEPAELEHLGRGVFHQDVDYDAATVTVDVFQAGPGDVNGDGLFNFSDLVAMFSESGAHYGSTDATDLEWTGGDFTGDGAFAFADLIAAFSSLGAHYGGGQYATSPAPLAAEESASFALGVDTDQGTTSIRRAAAFDAALEQPIERAPLAYSPLLSELSWMSDYERMAARNRSSRKDNSSEDAVDKLMATWP